MVIHSRMLPKNDPNFYLCQMGSQYLIKSILLIMKGSCLIFQWLANPPPLFHLNVCLYVIWIIDPCLCFSSL